MDRTAKSDATTHRLRSPTNYARSQRLIRRYRALAFHTPRAYAGFAFQLLPQVAGSDVRVNGGSHSYHEQTNEVLRRLMVRNIWQLRGDFDGTATDNSYAPSEKGLRTPREHSMIKDICVRSWVLENCRQRVLAGCPCIMQKTFLKHPRLQLGGLFDLRLCMIAIIWHALRSSHDQPRSTGEECLEAALKRVVNEIVFTHAPECHISIWTLES